MIKKDQRGFTLIELLVVTAVVALIAGATGMATVQAVNITQHSNEQMTVIRQAQNLGSWISRDAQMAEYVSCYHPLHDWLYTLFTWTEEPDSDNETWHMVWYDFDPVSGNIGEIERHHLSSAPPYYQKTTVAEHIYRNFNDPDNTTEFSYQDSVFTARITARLGETEASKEYKVYRRPNY
jgi:prepilin-type N-terminal cleavage/methylation domain-containing protein